MVALSDWMRGRETIVDDYAANRAHEFVDRANKALATMEDERDALVRPLNTQVRDINDRYRAPRSALEKVRDVLKGRLTAFAKRKEAEQKREAEEARRIAREAIEAAMAAEQRETEALIDDARHGVVDVDIGAIQADTAGAVADAAKACRVLARAEHAKVRIGGGFGRVLSLRDTETLTVTDWKAAIAQMIDDDGDLPKDITEAILKAARAYRKAFRELPNGITATFDRSL